MKVFCFILVVLLMPLAVAQWMMIAQQSLEQDTCRIPEERLTRLLEQAQLNEHRLAAVAAQNETLTTRTLAILDRLAPGFSPLPVASTAPVITQVHKPDAPLVLYEAEPVKAPARKGKRQ